MKLEITQKQAKLILYLLEDEYGKLIDIRRNVMKENIKKTTEGKINNLVKENVIKAIDDKIDKVEIIKHQLFRKIYMR